MDLNVVTFVTLDSFSFEKFRREVTINQNQPVVEETIDFLS